MPKTDSNLTSQIPKRVKNMTGQRFTRLLVIGYAGQFHNRAFWYCVCDCKSFVKVEGIKLRGGHSKSCGCYKTDLMAARSRTHGLCAGDNRISRPHVYRVWGDMHSRCYNPKADRYGDYGKRGITVCDRWHVFTNFLEDMGEPPTANHSIERINVNGNYEPDNCKWLLRSLQARNKRNNHFLTVNGETLCIAEWAERLNNNPSARTIWKRNRRGWSDGEALGFIQRTKNR